MSVGEALRRTVDGHRRAREDHHTEIVNMAGEIVRQHELDRVDVAADPTHTLESTEGATDDHKA